MKTRELREYGPEAITERHQQTGAALTYWTMLPLKPRHRLKPSQSAIYAGFSAAVAGLSFASL